MMLHLDQSDWQARYFVYTVVISTLVMHFGTPLKFRFSRNKDVGITGYLLLVGCFFYTRTPVDVIMPVFFADPAGAIVGRFAAKYLPVRNPKWIGEKTVLGSLAVFFVTFFTLIFGNTIERLVIAFTITIAEGYALDYDNIIVAFVVILSWVVVAKRDDAADGYQVGAW